MKKDARIHGLMDTVRSKVNVLLPKSIPCFDSTSGKAWERELLSGGGSQKPFVEQILKISPDVFRPSTS